MTTSINTGNQPDLRVPLRSAPQQEAPLPPEAALPGDQVSADFSAKLAQQSKPRMKSPVAQTEAPQTEVARPQLAAQPATLFMESAAIRANDTGPNFASLLAPTAAAQPKSPTFFDPLAAIPALEQSPLGDLLSNSSLSAADLGARKAEITAWAQQRSSFVAELKAAKASPDGLPALRAVEQKCSQRHPPATPEMRTSLMESYKDLGAFEDVARFYEKSIKQDPHFKAFEVPREYYIVALNKTKQTGRSITESRAYLAERLPDHAHQNLNAADAQLRRSYRDMGVNGEVLGGLGRAFKDVHSAAEKEIKNRIDGSGFGPLVEQLTGTKASQWSHNGVTLGAKADAAASALAQERLTAFSRRDTPESAQDLSNFLATSSGISPEKWASPQSPEALKQLLAGTRPGELVARAGEVVGQPLQNWSLRSQKLGEAQADALRPLLDGAVRLKLDTRDVAAGLRDLTGASMAGPIPFACLDHKIKDLSQDITHQGHIDVSLEKPLEETAGKLDGNLLAMSHKAMEVSRDYYMAGFGLDFEYYPGVNAIYNNLFLGNQKEAERLAPLVLRSCQREGGKDTKDYWNLATQVELGLIMNKPGPVLNALPRAMENAKAGWELSTTADSIEKLSKARQGPGSDTYLLDYVAGKLRERIEIGFPPKDPNFNQATFVQGVRDHLQELAGPKAVTATSLDPQRQAVTDAIMARSNNFSEIFNSKFVGGNVPFGGQIADIPINRPDIRALRGVISQLGLDKTEDFDTFNHTVDPYIDNRFGLVNLQTGKRVLEDLKSDEHHVMDEFSKKRHELTQAKASGTSKTNLSSELALGTGDCRHTGISKQGLFDLWKRDHQTGHLHRALDAVLKGDHKTYEAELDSVQKWDKLQLVTFTMAFDSAQGLHSGPDGKAQKYALAFDDQGRPVKHPQGQIQNVEDHTFNALVRFDDDGLVHSKEQGGLVAKDAFYKDYYALGDCSLDPHEILNPQGFDLGTIQVPTAQGEYLAVRGRPTQHSGNKPQAIAGECGQTSFGGLPVAFNDPQLLTRPRSVTRPTVDAVCNFVG